MPRNSCIYSVSGTSTFRLASYGIEQNYITHYTRGCNLQNIEKQVRRIYKADPKRILIQRDQGGAEALIVAYLCKLGNYRKLFLNKIKPHVYIALHVFPNVWQTKMQEIDSGHDTAFDIKEFLNLDVEKLNTHPQWKQLDRLIKSSDDWGYGERYYYIGKKICHASNYDMKGATFSLSVLEESRGKILIPKKEADKYLDIYHELFPEIRQDFHNTVQEQIAKTKTLYNLFGFPREFTEEMTGKNIKDAIAFIPQSTVATITNIAYTKMQNFIENEDVDWDLLAQTHDSLMGQCPDSDSEIATCNGVMKGFLEQHLKSPRGEEFQMQSSGYAGRNWAPYKEHKNERGLVPLAE